MTAVLTRGANTITAKARIGYEAEQESRTVAHGVLNGPTSYSLRPDGPRTGDLELLFWNAADAEAARVLLAQPGTWDLADDVTEIEMNFVRYGRLRIIQQANRARWILRVGFIEVVA